MVQRVFDGMNGTRILSMWLVGLLSLVARSECRAVIPETTQEIDLPAGWSLISIQVGSGMLPEQFRDAFDEPENLIEVWGYTPSGSLTTPGSWQTYQPKLAGFPDDLEMIEPGRAYWVKAAQFTTVALVGTPWDGAVSLQSGWNAVGFPGLSFDSTEEQELAGLFGASFDRISQAWAWDNSGRQRYVGYDTTSIPEVDELASVQPGSGYLIYALEPVLLTTDGYLALPQDADASPLQPEETFVAAEFFDEVHGELGRLQLLVHAEGLLVALVIRVRLQAVMVAVTIQLLP